MNKKVVARCCICGEEKELTYEHIPPKATFNNTPIKMYNGIDVLSENKAHGKGLEGFRYINQQKGAGAYTLCSRCNNFIGNKYNKEYEKLINYIGHIIGNNKSEKPYNIKSVTIPLDLMAIFKQVMAMFCSISDTCSYDRRLTDFIRDENSNDFDSGKYNLYFYGIHKNSKYGRIVGDSLLCRENKYAFKVSEISFFPVGFILNINESHNLHSFDIQCTNITDLSICSYGNKNQMELDFPVHLITSELLCDFDITEYSNKAED